MSSISLLPGATHVLKIRPNNALISSTVSDIDQLFDLSLLSGSKYSNWCSVAESATKIGIVDVTASESDKFIDSNFNLSTSVGSLWFKGDVQQNKCYYLQTGSDINISNNPLTFKNHICAHGYHEVALISVDRCGNKIATGLNTTSDQSGLIGKSFGFLREDRINSVDISPTITELFEAPKATISLVIKDNDVSTDFKILFSLNSSDYLVYGLQVSIFDNTLYIVGANIYSAMLQPYPFYVQAGEPYLLTFVFDGTQIDTDIAVQNTKRLKLYINDTDVPINFSEAVPDKLWSGSEGAVFVIGSDGYTVKGSIDESRITLDAWTPEEINLRYNQWFNQSTYWITTVQPVISSITTLGGKRWRVQGSGFKPESTDPTGLVSGIAFTVEAGATDSSFIITDNSDAPPGIQYISITNSDNETDYTLIASNTKRLVIEGESPSNFIGMPSSNLYIWRTST